VSLYKSKIAFGSEKDIDTAKKSGVLDPLDIIFTDEKRLIWIDKDGNTVYPRDEIAYTEQGVVIFEHDLVLSDARSSTECLVNISCDYELNIGKVYTITTDSGVYSSVCRQVVINDASCLVFGNTRHINGEDTGESFVVIICINEDGQCTCHAFDFNFGRNIKVSESDIIHKIDEKYLPDNVATNEDVAAAKVEAINMAKQYSDSKGGYTKPGKVLTFNGDLSGREIVIDAYVKISDSFIDVKTIESVCVYEQETNENATFTKEMFVYGIADICMLAINNDDGVLTLVMTTETGGYLGNEYLSKGTYILAAEGLAWVTQIVFSSIIVPFRKDLLPGVCLPVLELSQETMAGVFASGNAFCTAEEHAIIWGAYQALSSLIIKGNYNGIAFSGVSNILLDEYFNPYFMANAGKMNVQVTFDDKTANIRSVLDPSYTPDEFATKDYVDSAISTIPTPDVSGQIEKNKEETLGLAKEYTDSQRLAHVGPGKVFTYDGGEDAEFGEAGGFRVVRLSDGIFDLRKIKKIKCILANNGKELEFTEGDFVLRGPEDGISYIELAYGTTVLPALFAAQSGGLFGFAEPGIGYLSYVEFAETIVPIDPKFLPDETICLADYGTEGGTVNDILISLALEGGGTVTINSGMEKLWGDALATQPKNLIFDVGAGTDLRMSVCALFISESAVETDSATISANGLLSLYGTNLMGYFILASTGNGSGLKISVKSDPVEFTTAGPTFLPGVEIDLADYGVDAIGLFAQGGGTANLTNSDELWELVNSNKATPITFHFANSDIGMEIYTAATKTIGKSGKISGLTATIPVRTQTGTFVAYLWVSISEVKISVTESS
jgi:hypothetical protein